jgi:hypothetical protein
MRLTIYGADPWLQNEQTIQSENLFKEIEHPTHFFQKDSPPRRNSRRVAESLRRGW